MEIAKELKQQKYIDIHDGMLDESPFMMKVLELINEYPIGRLKEVDDYRAIRMEFCATGGVMIIEPTFFEYEYASVGYFYKLIDQCNNM